MIKKISIILFLFTLFVTSFDFNSVKANEKKFNMSYLYFGSTSDQFTYIDRTQGSLDMVTPNYFDINEDGSLKITNKFNENFVAEMKKRQIKIVPFLSNHWDRDIGRLGLEKREQLAHDIVQFVNKYQLDGVNVDLEGLTEQDRDAKTDLVRILKEKMPEGKTVSIAVAANPRGFKLGWHGSYDYEKLATYADFLMIMTYDESWHGSEPGPVASQQFVEKSVQYALNQQVAPEKIVLGLPFYGRIWRLDDVSTDSDSTTPKIKGNGVNLNRVERILSSFPANITYDEIRQSVKASFTITDQDPPFKLYGWSTEPMPPADYVIWYENEKSLKKKIELVYKYNLKGVGSWSLGQENPSIWNNFELWLNGLDFKDVPFTHWAQEDIAIVKEKGWISGRSETEFFPEGQLKRSEAASILVRSLGLSYTNSGTQQFSDVKAGHWAKASIEIAYQHGLMKGRGTTTFAPDEPVTREEMAVILSRILSRKSIPITDEIIFVDLKQNRWSYSLVMDMASKGIFSGFNDQTFRPKDEVTRAQMAALLYRISSYVE